MKRTENKLTWKCVEEIIMHSLNKYSNDAGSRPCKISSKIRTNGVVVLSKGNITINSH
jgi:hypothetical protein